jgi:membrane-bound serine protease (ClpP class)
LSQLTIIIALFICGLAAMCSELILPGIVVGIMGGLAVLGSIVYALATGHTVAGIVLMVCMVLFMPAFFFIWKNVVGRYMALKADEKGFSSSTTLHQELVGAEGLAESLLRPSGIARLNDKRYDVVTRGEMIEKGARIKVIEVSGNRIVVTRL